MFYSVLLRPLPFSDPDRLVIVSERAAKFPMLTASWLNFKDWKAQSTSFEEFGATRVVTMALTGSGQPEQIPGQMISGNLLHMLGVNTVLGKPISDVDDQPASPPVALLGYGLWQRRFGGAESVIGQNITLDRQTYSVIGVLPQGFELLQQAPDFVVAMGPWASKLPEDRSWHPGINAIARLKPGVSLSQARAEMSTIAKRLYAQDSSRQYCDRCSGESDAGAARERDKASVDDATGCSDLCAADCDWQYRQPDADARHSATARDRHPHVARRFGLDDHQTVDRGRTGTFADGRGGRSCAGLSLDAVAIRRRKVLPITSDCAGPRFVVSIEACPSQARMVLIRHFRLDRG